MTRGLLFFTLFIPAVFLTAQQDGAEIPFGKYRVLHSKILDEDRTLLVSLPDDYESSIMAYPVLYLLYGDQVKGYYAEAVNIVSRLGNAGEIPPFIIVGVANRDRYRDCLPLQPDGKPGGADKFLRFFNEELNPFISSNYRTKRFNLLVGPQAGAAFGLYAMMENTETFNAFIVSNPFWIEYTRSYFLARTNVFLNADSVPKNFMYVTYWDKEGWQDHRDAVEALNNYSELFTDQNPTNISLHLNYIPNNKDFIPPIGLKEGLRKFFQNYTPINYSELNTLTDIQKYYNSLSADYGYEIDIPEMLLVRKSDDLQSKVDLSEAKKILEYILKSDPKSLNALSRMANVHRTLGEHDIAISFFEKFLEIRKEPFFERQLNALLKFKKESAVYILEPILNASGIDAMLMKYRALKNDPQNNRSFDERDFNSWGYRLSQCGESLKAIEVFKLNIELHPKSANVYDSMGEAYIKIGNKQSAIENYKKALELNTGLESAKKALLELKE